MKHTCLYCSAEVRNLSCVASWACTDIEFFSCSACGAVTVSRESCEDVLALAYGKSYYGEGRRKFFPAISWLLSQVHHNRARDLCSMIPQDSKVLDIGCGDGSFALSLACRGLCVSAVEMPGEGFDRAKKHCGLKVNLIEGPFQSGMFENGSFNAVTLQHVLEHLSRPRESLHEISCLLKPGGILILSLPNIESRQYGLFGKDWFHLDPPQHLFFMGYESLLRELSEFGFLPIKKTSFSLAYDPYGYIQSVLNKLSDRPNFLYDSLKGKIPGDRYRRFFFESLVAFGLLVPSIMLSLCDALAKKSATMEIWLVRG